MAIEHTTYCGRCGYVRPSEHLCAIKATAELATSEVGRLRTAMAVAYERLNNAPAAELEEAVHDAVVVLRDAHGTIA